MLCLKGDVAVERFRLFESMDEVFDLRLASLFRKLMLSLADAV